MLSLLAPLPKLKYWEESATEDVYAHMPALNPLRKFVKPALGNCTKSLVPLKLRAVLNGVGFESGVVSVA